MCWNSCALSNASDPCCQKKKNKVYCKKERNICLYEIKATSCQEKYWKVLRFLVQIAALQEEKHKAFQWGMITLEGKRQWLDSSVCRYYSCWLPHGHRGRGGSSLYPSFPRRWLRGCSSDELHNEEVSLRGRSVTHHEVSVTENHKNHIYIIYTVHVILLRLTLRWDRLRIGSDDQAGEGRRGGNQEEEREEVSCGGESVLREGERIPGKHYPRREPAFWGGLKAWIAPFLLSVDRFHRGDHKVYSDPFPPAVSIYWVG